MKNAFFFSIILSLLNFSCTVTVNEKDEIETLKNENGFSYENISVSINKNFPIKNNELIAGEYVVITYLGVKNATLKEGYQHVGLGIKIIDETGKVIEESADLFSNIEQQASDLEEFKAYYVVPPTYTDGAKLTIITTLFDKYGTVKYEKEQEFVVTYAAPPVTENILLESNIETKDSFQSQIFDGSSQFITTPVVATPTSSLDLYVNNVTGFEILEGKIFIKYSVQLLDESNNELYITSDQFDGKVGDKKTFQLTANMAFDNIASGNYFWVVTFEDVNSTKFIKTIIDVVIE
jgi:hypothetical protein